jgi:hypothetical protein
MEGLGTKRLDTHAPEAIHGLFSAAQEAGVFSGCSQSGVVLQSKDEDEALAELNKTLSRIKYWEEDKLARKAIEGEETFPRIKVDKKGRSISVDHPNYVAAYKLLAEALGSTSKDFVDGLACQLAQATRLAENEVNFALSVIKNSKPNDQIEAMLVAQMAVTHIASMRLAGRAATAETLPQADSAERAFNKLTRTYTNQMQALKRYRTGGEQKVTVQHVSINDNAQAVIGNVVPGPSGNARGTARAPLPLSDARQAPMPVMEELEAELVSLKGGQQK